MDRFKSSEMARALRLWALAYGCVAILLYFYSSASAAAIVLGGLLSLLAVVAARGLRSARR